MLLPFRVSYQDTGSFHCDSKTMQAKKRPAPNIKGIETVKSALGWDIRDRNIMRRAMKKNNATKIGMMFLRCPLNFPISPLNSLLGE